MSIDWPTCSIKVWPAEFNTSHALFQFNSSDQVSYGLISFANWVRTDLMVLKLIHWRERARGGGGRKWKRRLRLRKSLSPISSGANLVIGNFGSFACSLFCFYGTNQETEDMGEHQETSRTTPTTRTTSKSLRREHTQIFFSFLIKAPKKSPKVNLTKLWSGM